jgi:hypothetical protein
VVVAVELGMPLHLLEVAAEVAQQALGFIVFLMLQIYPQQ